jgi:hypothetical protein
VEGAKGHAVGDGVGLALSSPTGAFLGGQGSAELTIRDTSTPPPVIPLTGEVTALVSVGRPPAKKEVVVVTNTSGRVLAGPLVLALDRLPKAIKLRGAPGFEVRKPRRGSPRVIVSAGQFAPGQQVTVTLTFTNPTGRVPRFTPRLVAGFTGA